MKTLRDLIPGSERWNYNDDETVADLLKRNAETNPTPEVVEAAERYVKDLEPKQRKRLLDAFSGNATPMEQITVMLETKSLTRLQDFVKANGLIRVVNRDENVLREFYRYGKPALTREATRIVDFTREHMRIEAKVKEWFKNRIKLKRCEKSRMHDLRAAWRREDIWQPTEDQPTAMRYGPLMKLLQDLTAETPPTFVVQNDWAKPFAGVEDFEGGEIILPFDKTAFEFNIDGVHVIAIADFEGTTLGGSMFIEIEPGKWFVMGDVGFTSSTLTKPVPMLDMIYGQIRAICIALDADVAEHAVVRAPYAENRARAKQHLPPLRDFHIVRLSSRSRATRSLDGQAGVGSKRRQHFRRGHWRHFQSGHKTWIKWMLVGDPDLGFIQKEYRL